MRLSCLIAVLSLCAFVSGCARWNEPEKKSTVTFPKSRIAVDAVGIELAVAQIDSSQSATFEEFWGLLDQQELPLRLRKRLDQNGLRVAIMSPQPPASFHQLVQPKPIKHEELTELEIQLHAKGLLRKKERLITHERISNREGQSHLIPISDYHGEFSWVVRNGNKQTAGFGKTVRGLISVTTFPQGDGSVRMIFRPEIHHGQSRSRIGVAERSFLLKEGQAVLPVDDLKFEVTLRSGESIVFAPTEDVGDLGNLLFGKATTPVVDQTVKNPSVPTHRMLLVRVVQTQMDDLFSDSNLAEKLTTTPRH